LAALWRVLLPQKSSPLQDIPHESHICMPHSFTNFISLNMYEGSDHVLLFNVVGGSEARWGGWDELADRRRTTWRIRLMLTLLR